MAGGRKAAPRSRRGRAEPERLMKGSEAARALKISMDTLRRWDHEGRLRVVRDTSNRRMVPVSEVERLAGHLPTVRTGARLSARNRLPVVATIKATSVMVSREDGRMS